MLCDGPPRSEYLNIPEKMIYRPDFSNKYGGDLLGVVSSLSLYRVDVGKMPKNLLQLVSDSVAGWYGPYINGESIRDRWGYPFAYYHEGDSFIITYVHGLESGWDEVRYPTAGRQILEPDWQNEQKQKLRTSWQNRQFEKYYRARMPILAMLLLALLGLTWGFASSMICFHRNDEVKWALAALLAMMMTMAHVYEVFNDIWRWY